MRSFGSRADCAVVDEPLYAAYLSDTGKQHPMRAEVLSSQPNDWRDAVANLEGPIPGGVDHFYQKQMAHHLLPDRFGPWLERHTHILLVRDPAEMLSSLLAAWPEAELEDTGLPQQLEIRKRLGDVPVVEGRAILDDPEGTLRALCERLGLPWNPAMLSWREGPQPDDGVWGTHWYASLWKTTGFEPWRPRQIRIPDEKRPLLRQCMEIYEALLTR